MIALSVKNENGDLKEYQVDSEIVKGLYLTYDLEKVIANSQNFGVLLNEQLGKVATKIKSLKEVSIVTIEVSADKKFQYFVGNDLGLEALVKVPENQMPNNIKEVVLKAYHLIQKSHLVSKIQMN
ncbi:MAG: hypothetical protein N4A35_08050 [Flavobacteriales bacterium]|jgi:hypothetical protein|nr:hypothetical protein [Flavobacteriales bacterium]